MKEIDDAEKIITVILSTLLTSFARRKYNILYIRFFKTEIIVVVVVALNVRACVWA
jgi:hypothetical protein